MKVFRSLFLITIFGYMPLTLAEQVVEFQDPIQFCTPETQLHGAPTHTTLSYIQNIREEDYNKKGDIFIAFRNKNTPNQLWLLNRLKQWNLYALDQQPLITHAAYSGNLNPLKKLTIFGRPTDVSDYTDGGEIWVGYGLREHEDASINDSFQDMLDQRRYGTLWNIASEHALILRSFCLTVTQMKDDGGGYDQQPVIVSGHPTEIELIQGASETP